MKLPRSQEWITPDAYHFERRGGRSCLSKYPVTVSVMPVALSVSKPY
jgi:hypothetical protein